MVGVEAKGKFEFASSLPPTALSQMHKTRNEGDKFSILNMRTSMQLSSRTIVTGNKTDRHKTTWCDKKTVSET